MRVEFVKTPSSSSSWVRERGAAPEGKLDAEVDPPGRLVQRQQRDTILRSERRGGRSGSGSCSSSPGESDVSESAAHGRRLLASSPRPVRPLVAEASLAGIGSSSGLAASARQ